MPDDAIRARSFWSGTISFGLVSIPVALYSGNRPRRVSLRMLDDDGTPLSRRYYCPADGREVSSEELIRGYEMEDGSFVIVTDEELEALEPDKTRDIDLRRFVDADALDPIYFDRAYFLAPDGSSSKAYRLLAEVMERTNRAGIATFVMRTREYLVAILAENGILRAETLRFPAEIRPVEEIGLPDRPKVPKKRVTAIEKAMKSVARKTLDESDLEDEYAARLEALVERKRKKKQGVKKAPAAAREDTGEADVIDLMEVLKRSLRGAEPESESGPESGNGAGDLESLTKAELYEQAQRLDIGGRSQMNKGQLIRAIRKSA